MFRFRSVKSQLQTCPPSVPLDQTVFEQVMTACDRIGSLPGIILPALQKFIGTEGAGALPPLKYAVTDFPFNIIHMKTSLSRIVYKQQLISIHIRDI